MKRGRRESGRGEEQELFRLELYTRKRFWAVHGSSFSETRELHQKQVFVQDSRVAQEGTFLGSCFLHQKMTLRRRQSQGMIPNIPPPPHIYVLDILMRYHWINQHDSITSALDRMSTKLTSPHLHRNQILFRETKKEKKNCMMYGIRTLDSSLAHPPDTPTTRRRSVDVVKNRWGKIAICTVLTLTVCTNEALGLHPYMGSVEESQATKISDFLRSASASTWRFGT